MYYVPILSLLNKTNSMYKLVVMASRRATELNGGAAQMVETDEVKPTSVALEEIMQDKVKLSNGKKK